MAKKLIKYNLDLQTLSTPSFISNGGLVPNYVADQGYPNNTVMVGITIDEPGDVGLQTFTTQQELEDYLLTYVPSNYEPYPPPKSRINNDPPTPYDPVATSQQIWNLYISL
jgi:hypothetical protein